jgi:alpha-mannosidase
MRHPVFAGELKKIQASVYTIRRSLSAEILVSKEPVTFGKMLTKAFTPVQPGFVWGRKLDCAWLHIRGEVPAGLKNPVALLENSGEALVYDKAGTPVQGLSFSWFPGQTPQSGGSRRAISALSLEPGPLDFYVDCGFNGVMMIGIGKAKFGGAWLAEKDEAAYRCFYDCVTLFLLYDALENGPRRREIAAILRRAFAAFRSGGAEAALTVTAGAFTRGNDEADLTFGAVGHSHLDQAWLWPIRETKRKAARTYAAALVNLQKHPAYIYGTSQSQQLWWTRENYPAIYSRVREAIRAGRIEMQGRFWVECDVNISGGESLVRQAIYGSRFNQEEFGRLSRVCWLPDAFGFSGALPQILRGCGMPYFSTIKLSWNQVNVFPYRSFWWEGIDGSRVLVHMPPEGNYNSEAQPASIFTAVKKYTERSLGAGLLVYGEGDGGGGPNETHLELLAREKKLPDFPAIKDTTAEAFFGELEAAKPQALWRGELYLETHQGTYTTQALNKYYNRLCEGLLHNAEALLVMQPGIGSRESGIGNRKSEIGNREPGAGIREMLDEAWREVLLYQFHDIIPGSSIGRVNREAVDGYRKIEERLRGLIAGLLGAPGDKVTLVNLGPFDRTEFVKVGGKWLRAEAPSYGAACAAPAAGPFPELAFGENEMSNGLITLKFGPGGEIVSCVEGGWELSQAGLNRLVLFTDKFTVPFNAWNIDPGYRKRPKRQLRPFDVRTEIDGPRVLRTCRYRFGKSAMTQKVIIEAGSLLVRFETEVDWHEKHRMLRAEFFPADYGDKAKCEIQFGYIERPTTERDSVEKAQFEVCAHRWAAVEKDGRGFAVLNDSKYGYRVKNGLLSLNLLRSPTFPDKEADRGEQRFVYAFLPFGAGSIPAVVREAWRLNQPLLPAACAPFASAVRVAGADSVLIETLKPAENGEGAILRLYECAGREAEADIDTSIPHSAAYLTDMLENRLEKTSLRGLKFRPFEIKTVELAK